ncbi:MAG TPA: hypothetical protein VED19_01930 [Candidatus Nitrosopolaris sp.]|nr:hypothetical protein [Candidatus Nitrosopolaris sp.]
MKTVFRLILLAVLVALGVWLWFVLFPSPEKIIRQRLTELARTASFSSNEGNLARLAAAQSLAGFFATNVEVDINVPGRVQHTLVGRDEIQQAALGARERLSGLKVTFPDINITVAPDKQSALADLTVEASVSGEGDSIVQEMKITFQQTDGHWLIMRVETVRTLS